MYWLAMLTMLIDHVGLVFFPTDPAWRIAGRLAFPIYAYALYADILIPETCRAICSVYSDWL